MAEGEEGGMEAGKGVWVEAWWKREGKGGMMRVVEAVDGGRKGGKGAWMVEGRL